MKIRNEYRAAVTVDIEQDVTQFVTKNLSLVLSLTALGISKWEEKTNKCAFIHHSNEICLAIHNTDEKGRSADAKVGVFECGKMMKPARRGVSVATDAGTHSHKGNL